MRFDWNRYMFYIKKFGIRYMSYVILGHIDRFAPYFLYRRAECLKKYYLSPEICMEREIEELYQISTGRKMDIADPVTLNEKIQWLKLRDVTEEKRIMSDKLLARRKIAEIAGEEHLVRLIGTYDKFSDIDFYDLPEKFVIKSSQGSHFCAVVKDKNKADWQRLGRCFKWWLKTDFAFLFLEMQYEKSFAKIVVEEYIGGEDEFQEYKFMCFNGEPCFFWVRGSEHGKLTRNFYDMEWNEIEFHFGDAPKADKIIKPSQEMFKELRKTVKKLCEGYRFVRVDTFVKSGTFYIGELTFATGAGYDRWLPESDAVRYGKLIPAGN